MRFWKTIIALSRLFSAYTKTYTSLESSYNWLQDCSKTFWFVWTGKQKIALLFIKLYILVQNAKSSQSLVVKYHSNKSVSGFVKIPNTCRVIEILLFQLKHNLIRGWMDFHKWQENDKYWKFYNSQTCICYQNSYLLECQFLDDSDKFLFAFSFLKFLY